MLIALHKPYGFLSQFTPEPGSKWRTLSELGLPRRVYPIGRLDADSEGLLLLSDEPCWNARLLRPEHGHFREYWVQVEGIPDDAALLRLQGGVRLGDWNSLPCEADLLDPQPAIAARVPPVRLRKTVPDRWISMRLVEGKNRQVRRMTAAVGHPTLRLIRVRIGRFSLWEGALGEPGLWKTLSSNECDAVCGRRGPGAVGGRL